MGVLWASRVTYLLILILNLSTWIDLLGIWAELPLIIAHLPEDSSSSLIYFDYMKRFRPKYLNAMFFGESLTCFIPTLIAFAQ
ncbi:unnamed protein product, partial [Didymodactylos carnosus]